MNWNEAIKTMKKGIMVESTVSYTQYEIDEKGQLLAEGSPVKDEYVTKEEIEGEFKIAKPYYYGSGSAEDLDEFMDKSYKHGLYVMAHEEIKSNNIIRN